MITLKQLTEHGITLEHLNEKYRFVGLAKLISRTRGAILGRVMEVTCCYKKRVRTRSNPDCFSAAK